MGDRDGSGWRETSGCGMAGVNYTMHALGVGQFLLRYSLGLLAFDTKKYPPASDRIKAPIPTSCRPVRCS